MWAALTAAAAIAEILSLLLAWGAYRRRRNLKKELAELRLVPEEERARLLERKLDRFGVAAAGLSKKDSFLIIQQTIERQAERFRRALWAGVSACLIFAALTAYAWTLDQSPDLYRLRVTVLAPDGRPSNNAFVSTSVGGEILKAHQGWEILLPRNRRGQAFTVFASYPEAFLQGRQEVALGDDFEPPAIEIQLSRREVEVRGTVIDPQGHGVAGATVSVVGFEQESVGTDTSGNFRLQAHAADRQTVRLRVVKDGRSSEFEARAGDLPAQQLVWEEP
ncbi:MAG TPA: carboxypeptidase-like regulatory domain-containing protein [Thermoanaerobaculia bacterium]|nr:carboxypeptidase-like regulatory domain-containing protein [Thermoanaerobaculia bacterium]